MATSAVEELLAEGWPIAEDRIHDCFGNDALTDVLTLRRKMLDTDIREYSSSSLAARVDKNASLFKGPLTVQLVKVRNVSYPKYSESTHPEGILKMQLSDGFSNVQALAIDRIPKLNADTPPGTKCRLFGTIQMENGLIIINASNCCCLGGVVHHLYEKWSMEKDWLQKTVRTGNSNAPKWVKFSKEGASVLSALNASNRGFRANDVITGAAKTNPVEENGTFSVTRKAQIEQIVESSAVKRFARSKLRKSVPPVDDAVPTSSKKELPAKISINSTSNKARLAVRESKRDVSPIAKPSKAPTLLDFMQGTIPGLSTTAETTDNSRNRREENRRSDMRQDTAGKFGKPARKQQHGNAQRTRDYGEPGQVMRQTFVRQDRQLNVRSSANNINNNDPVLDPADFPAVSEVNKGMANIQIDAGKLPDIGVGYEPSSSHHNDQLTNNYFPRVQFPNCVINSFSHFWNIGDHCLAPWTDGQFYLCTLISVGPADMCTVEYVDYGNRSTVPIGALLPL